MKRTRRICTTLLALATVALPATAGAGCLNKTDMHALQAASLQQRLMVAAFTCHDSAAYNAFVLAHRSELQQSDATLLAFFQKNGGTAAYHSYKTHLANASALESSRSDGFCSDAGGLFHAVSASGSLTDMLDGLPTADTGYTACYTTEARNTPRSERTDIRIASATPLLSATRPAPDERYTRRTAHNRDADASRERRFEGDADRYDDDRYADDRYERDSYADDRDMAERDSPPPRTWRERDDRDDFDPRDRRDDRYAWRSRHREPMYGPPPPPDDDADW